jgi:hypothetical protein
MSNALDLKIWPVLGLSAIRHRHPGAWRAWEIARHIDQNGSGKVNRFILTDCLKNLGVNSKTRRRWLDDALAVGLLLSGKGNMLSPVGAARAAELLYVTHIGEPARINSKVLVKACWRSHVFEAFCATLTGPMSQRTKMKLTRITPRTQRNYLKKGLGRSLQNYAKRPENADHLHGLREVRGLAVFINYKGELIQRGPDFRIVPPTVALPAPKGRARKIQKQLNALCFQARGNVQDCFKLFYEEEKDARAAVRTIGRSESDDRPREVFHHIKSGDDWNLWRIVNVAA